MVWVRAPKVLGSTHWVDDLQHHREREEAAAAPILAGSEPVQHLDSWLAKRTFNWPWATGRPLVENRTVWVGSRIQAPLGEIGAGGGAEYLAGFIRESEGNAYHPTAYQDPFAAGFEAANQGAIIPVNAIPGNGPDRGLVGPGETASPGPTWPRASSRCSGQPWWDATPSNGHPPRPRSCSPATTAAAP